MNENLSTQAIVSDETMLGTVLRLTWTMVLVVFVGPGLALKNQ